jgi:uncharacterized membrane protein YciS (DUF1049 family)
MFEKALFGFMLLISVILINLIAIAARTQAQGSYFAALTTLVQIVADLGCIIGLLSAALYWLYVRLRPPQASTTPTPRNYYRYPFAPAPFDLTDQECHRVTRKPPPPPRVATGFWSIESELQPTDDRPAIEEPPLAFHAEKTQKVVPTIRPSRRKENIYVRFRR